MTYVRTERDRKLGIHGPCLCREWCGDADDEMPEDDPSMPVCKGLRPPPAPLVEVVLIPREEMLR